MRATSLTVAVFFVCVSLLLVTAGNQEVDDPEPGMSYVAVVHTNMIKHRHPYIGAREVQQVHM